MADKIQFEDQDSRKPAACAVCEAMLPDAVDGALSAAEQQAFDRHVATCVECSAELAAAKRGAAWLAMLKGNAPEPPPALLERILAGTTWQQARSCAMKLRMNGAPRSSRLLRVADGERGWLLPA